jgi:hypothetical protein
MTTRPTNVRFNRGGNITNIPKYFENSEITERDLLFLNGYMSSSKTYPVEPADTLIMAEVEWVDKLKGAMDGNGDIVEFFEQEGPAPIVATSRLSLINPDFGKLDSKEAKLVVARGVPTNVKYNVGGEIIAVEQYENSLDIFDILYSAGLDTYSAATDSNIPTGKAVRDMIAKGIDNFVDIMEYKGALTSTTARHDSEDIIQKGWVYIASTDIYGYKQNSTYTYSTTPQTSQGTLVFRCEQGDMVVAKQNISENVPLMNSGNSANCDVFERNLTGAVTATGTFGAANKVILSESGSRTIKSIDNGSDGSILTIVNGVPAWQAPSASAEVNITQDETTDEYKAIIFSGIESGQQGVVNTTTAETVYYSSKAGFNPSTGKFATKDISVHRDLGDGDETAWVSQSIFWNVLETETQE